MGKFIVCVLSLIVLLTAGSAQAVDRNWTGAGADDLWTTAANWDTGVPGVGDNGNINNGGSALIDSTVTADLDRVELCNSGSGGATLTMTGGSVNNRGQYPITIGSKPGAGLGTFNLSGGDVSSDDGFLISNSGGSAGVVNMSGGTIDSQATYSPSGWWSMFGVGDAGVGTLNMSGGAVTCNTMKIPSRSGEGNLNMTGGTIDVVGGLYVNASGDVHLDNGVITAANLYMSAPGSMDLMEGVMILDGDDRSVIEGYIDSGLITGYGGEGDLSVDYDTVNDITTVTAIPQGSVSNPVPANDAINVPPDVVLSWDAPDPNYVNELPARYNVYFGEEPNELSPNFTLVSENQSEKFYDPDDPNGADLLDLLTDYYWRIDTVDPNYGEAIVYTGILWHFTTIPPKATEPVPQDEATGVAQNVELSWTSGYGADSHDVYISTVQSEVENGTAPMVNRTESNYDPPDLAWETEYFWRVDEVFDGGGDPEPGDVWSFTTGIPVCEYELEGDLDNNCVVNLKDFARMASNWLVCNLSNGDCP